MDKLKELIIKKHSYENADTLLEECQKKHKDICEKNYTDTDECVIDLLALAEEYTGDGDNFKYM